MTSHPAGTNKIKVKKSNKRLSESLFVIATNHPPRTLRWLGWLVRGGQIRHNPAELKLFSHKLPMPAKPRVSVIITTYNRADFLVEAIASVLAQTYQDFELIVADDGSTDDTAIQISSFGDRLRYLPLVHSGRPEDVRNAGIVTAQGELIAFLDDDDRWHEDKLSRQVAIFDKDQTVGMVYCDVQFILADDSLSPPALPAWQKHSIDVFDRLLADCFIHPSTVMVKRRLFEEIGLFEKRFYSQADYYFWLQVAHTTPVRCLPESLTLARRHPSNISETRNLRHYQCAIDVLAHLEATLPLTRRQQFIVRRTLARWHTHVGLALRPAKPNIARQHFLRSLRLNPFQRRAWLALLAR